MTPERAEIIKVTLPDGREARCVIKGRPYCESDVEISQMIVGNEIFTVTRVPEIEAVETLFRNEIYKGLMERRGKVEHV